METKESTAKSLTEELEKMSSPARHELYRRIYEGGTTMLADLRTPAACDAFPVFAEEILESYLHYTTFYVKVWLNYDGVEDAFYQDRRRVSQCGKLRMPKGARSRLKQTVSGDLRLPRVTIELCTMFTSYATLRIGDGDLLLDLSQLDDDHHRTLILSLVRLHGRIRQRYVPIAATGLTLRELEGLAAMLIGDSTQRVTSDLDLD